MNLLKILKSDHREVESLFKRIEMTSERAVKVRQKLFLELMLKLDAHATAEEEILYAPMKQEEKAKADILEAFEEHGVARIMLQEIRAMSADDERWIAKVTVLREMIQHHVEEEEAELFKKVQKTLDAADLGFMGERFEARKAELLRSSQPGKMLRSMNRIFKTSRAV